MRQIWMATSEGRLAALFTEAVSISAEGEVAIDETASTVSFALNVCVVPGVSAAVEEGEECVGEFVSPVSDEESAARHLEGEVDDNDSFVEIMSGILSGCCGVWGLDFCWSAGTCELVSGDSGRGCCWHTSFAYTWVFFLHSSLAFGLLENYGGHSYFP